LIDEVHRRGLRFMLWVSPKTQCDVGYARSQLLGPIEQLVVNLFQPAVAREFERRPRAPVPLGGDGFKADRGGEGHLRARPNAKPLVYARDVTAVLRGRPAIFRAGAMGSQSVVHGLWAGDQEGTWAGLQAAIRAGESAAMSGFPTWGSDVGGYHSASLTG